jgi:hypothetical protein
MAEWRSRLGCLEPIGRRSSGVAHLPQEKFQRRFSALNGLELRLHASSFLQAPTYSGGEAVSKSPKPTPSPTDRKLRNSTE